MIDRDTRRHSVSLDWDYVRFRTAMRRMYQISTMPYVENVVLMQSATKGYHCLIDFDRPVHIALVRFDLDDDPRRLLHDLLDKPRDIDTLSWDHKWKYGRLWEAKTLWVYRRQLGWIKVQNPTPRIVRKIRLLFYKHLYDRTTSRGPYYYRSKHSRNNRSQSHNPVCRRTVKQDLSEPRNDHAESRSHGRTVCNQPSEHGRRDKQSH